MTYWEAGTLGINNHRYVAVQNDRRWMQMRHTTASRLESYSSDPRGEEGRHARN